jgi:hypothetical protein
MIPDKKEAPSGASLHYVATAYFAALARRLLCLAAAFLWIRPFREARSRSLTAASFSSAFPPEEARLSAVRRADLWARFRIAAARDFRMFFFAEAILGTN